jgi:hypothetical protein
MNTRLTRYQRIIAVIRNYIIVRNTKKDDGFFVRTKSQANGRRLFTFTIIYVDVIVAVDVDN